jgi:hypothetical protein
VRLIFLCSNTTHNARFGRGRTTRHIDVDPHDPVAIIFDEIDR